MKTNKFTYAVLVLPSLMIQPMVALAADNNQQPVMLEKIIVTDKKLVAGEINKTEINAEDITHRQGQAQDTAKLLEDIAGVSL